MHKTSPLIQLKKVSKVFFLRSKPSLFESVFDRSKKDLKNHQTKLSLNCINLEIYAGEKVGIIGCNGSGKSTLLKIITGYTEPTTGKVQVSGTLQAMMQTGFGFKDELTGFENIQNSLLFNGLSPRQRSLALQDIIEFVELGEFLFYPLKTYSMGMRARLEFTTATAIAPDILIIDEILSAGDGYFGKKCAERMHNLIKSTTLLLVSHSMQQILMYCDRTIWINEGKIVEDGTSQDVIDKYSKFISSKTIVISKEDDLASSVARVKESLPVIPLEFQKPIKTLTSKSSKLVANTLNQDGYLKITKVGFGEQWHSYVAAETGDPLSINIQFQSLSNKTKYVQATIFGLTSEGSLIWKSQTSFLKVKHKKTDIFSEIKLFFPKFLVGIGNYYLTIQTIGYSFLNPSYSQADRHKYVTTIAIKHCPLLIRVLPTNFSDPPFIHCPGEWYYESEPTKPIAARINAWC